MLRLKGKSLLGDGFLNLRESPNGSITGNYEEIGAFTTEKSGSHQP